MSLLPLWAVGALSGLKESSCGIPFIVPGGDSEALLISPQEKHVNMVHIESRKSRRRSSEVEIFVDFECGKTEFNELIQSLKFQTTILTLNPPENIWTEEEGKASFCLLGDFAI